jgi:hypothetical protein
MLQVCQDIYPGRIDYIQTITNAWASTGYGEPLLPGDVNSDGYVNIQDIIIMINIILGNIIPTEAQLANGDITGEGNIDVLDIVNVVNIILYG